MKHIFSAIMISLFIFKFAIAYDNINVHPKINENATTQGHSLFFADYLGFQDGKKQLLEGKRVFEWLKEGGKKEDIPEANGRLHFHNPLRPWEESGFWEDTILGPLTKSSILWSQEKSLSGNQWSWPYARRYYFDALTARDKITREVRFASAFRALGQVMHLLADSAVPAHTRNDLHYWPREIFGVEVGRHTYETWARNNADLLNYSATPLNYSLTRQAVFHSLAPLPISAFWDLDQYTGTNPTRTLTTPIGLAEFTNANFFSEDTVFKDFPHPAQGDTNYSTAMSQPEEVIAEDGKMDLRCYIRSTSGGMNHRLAAFSYLTPYSLGQGNSPPFIQDDQVYADYASILIPKAVSYASGLVDYFFRGTLEVSAPDRVTYAIADGSGTQEFTRLRAKVRNATPNETASAGIIQAVARYKKRTDYQRDLSTDPPTASSSEADFSFSVSEPITVDALDSVTPAEFAFDFSSNPIPAGITDLYLHVVFKGTLGNETDDAVAVGMKDISEPMHIITWNATDRFYLNRVLRTAEEIRKTPSLLEIVDHDSDGTPDEFIDPYDLKTELAFSSSSTASATYDIQYAALPPGSYGRVIVITDLAPFYMHVRRESTNPPDTLDTSFSFSPVVNQENYSSQIDTFRGVKGHQWTAFSRYYPDSMDITNAPWPNPVQTEPIPPSTIQN